MTVSRNDGTEQAEEELCICCPTAVSQLFCSSNTGHVERKCRDVVEFRLQARCSLVRPVRREG